MQHIMQGDFIIYRCLIMLMISIQIYLRNVKSTFFFVTITKMSFQLGTKSWWPQKSTLPLYLVIFLVRCKLYVKVAHIGDQGKDAEMELCKQKGMHQCSVVCKIVTKPKCCSVAQIIISQTLHGIKGKTSLFKTLLSKPCK